MEVSYSWMFCPLDVKVAYNGMQNVVYRVNWSLIGTDGEFTESVYGACRLPNPDYELFVPFENLSESLVKEWVEQALGAEQVQLYKTALSEAIFLKKNPSHVSLNPAWSLTNDSDSQGIDSSETS